MKYRISIVAGKKAYDLIRKEGFYPEMIRTVVSAAGGPKWFSIYGLTRYVIGHLLKHVNRPVHLLGSSVGAWQMTAAACSDPIAAIDRLRDAYGNHIYPDNPKPYDISQACRQIVHTMIEGQENIILNNPNRNVHIITTRGKGILNSQGKLKLSTGFAFTALANTVGRRHMNWSVERTIFSNTDQTAFNEVSDLLPTRRYRLEADNLLDALQASGAIPLLMEGVRMSSGARHETYWDGGITDYQISLPFDHDEGIAIHPHFSPNVLAGWFDKKLPWLRKASQENMSNVLLIFPTPEFIESLPEGRISELKDFERFGVEQDKRTAYWAEISRRSMELADELDDIIERGYLPSLVKRYI